MSHVVAPEIGRLTLADGHFVDVKKELNAGEYVDLLTDQGKGMYFAKVLHYVVAWSFVGLNGKPLPYSLEMPITARLDTVRALNVPTVKELVAAIDAHEAAQELARSEAKASPFGEPVLSAI